MSYATKEEVKSMFRDFADNDEAAVSDDELDLFLLNAHSIINAKISALYTLPITEADSPNSFNILKQIEMYKVACIVDDILNNYSEADKKPSWCKQANMLLESIAPSIDKKGKQPTPSLILPDSDYNGTATQKNQISILSTSESVFKKNADNW